MKIGDKVKTKKACRPAGAFYSYPRGSEVTIVNLSGDRAVVETYGGGYASFALADLRAVR